MVFRRTVLFRLVFRVYPLLILLIIVLMKISQKL